MKGIAIAVMMYFSINVQATQPRYRTVYSPDWSSLERLPPDSGGTLHIQTGESFPGAPNGFFWYTPAGYKDSKIKYPLLIFFHGRGQRGDSLHDAAPLNKILRFGPVRLIHSGEWKPPVPFFVLAPQAHPQSYWEGLPTLIDGLAATYPIDTTRIYLTGLSMGGFFTWWSAGKNGDRSMLAAIVPICGGLDEDYLKLEDAVENLQSIPVWAFHGFKDRVIHPKESIRIVERVNASQPPFPIKFTLFNHLAHNTWTTVYESDFAEETDANWQPFDRDIYSWMLQYRRIPKEGDRLSQE